MPDRYLLDCPKRFYSSSHPCRFTFARGVQSCSSAFSPVASAAKQYQQHYANETVPLARKRWSPHSVYYPRRKNRGLASAGVYR